jgi:phosphosulfolactate phosphohydrolase-like enzyme
MAKLNPMIWETSLSKCRILGSCSPATFNQKFEQIPPSGLQSSVAIFVDILRATTTLVAIGASGCKGILVNQKPKSGEYIFKAPFLEHEEWVFGGELNGNPIEGIDGNVQKVKGVIDNSPIKVDRSIFNQKYLNFYSTNGAQAFDVLVEANFNSVFALSLANINPTADAIVAMNPERIWIVGGGFYGGSSIEDSVAAGFLIARLLDLGFANRDQLDDEAETMRIHALYFQQGREVLNHELLSRLRTGQVSRLLTTMGHEKDVIACGTGQGMEGTWNEMKKIALVCRDMKTRLLVPEY